MATYAKLKFDHAIGKSCNILFESLVAKGHFCNSTWDAMQLGAFSLLVALTRFKIFRDKKSITYFLEIFFPNVENCPDNRNVWSVRVK